MFALRRAVAVLSVVAGLLCLATSAAEASAANGKRRCEKTFSMEEFDRAARAVYAGTDLPRKGSYGHLWRYARCVRPPATESKARSYWRTQYERWKARRHPAAPSLAYGNWAIPAAIVMCESGGANLAPNSAGASGYYQVIPSTWIAYGGGRYASQAYLASKSAQDEIAARIWAGGSGAGQWVCKG